MHARARASVHSPILWRHTDHTELQSTVRKYMHIIWNMDKPIKWEQLMNTIISWVQFVGLRQWPYWSIIGNKNLIWSSSSDNPKTIGKMVLCCVVEWAPRRVWGQKQILSIDFIFIGPCESLQIESIAYTKITLHHYSICGNVWLKQKKNCAINFLAWPRNRLKGQQQQQQQRK